MTVTELRLRPPVPAAPPPALPAATRRIALAWAALLLNVLAFYGMPIVLPIPQPVGQLLTQGALVAALFLALTVNRRVIVRPNVFVVVFTVAAMITVMVSVHAEYFMGSTYRSIRFVTFIAVLWLLTPLFGRRDMLLLRCHRWCLGAVLTIVVAGAVVAPGMAFGGVGRLAGVLWPIPPPQVAHYAAIVLGTTVLLWMCRVVPGRSTGLVVAATAGILVATHTRTALVGLMVGLLVGGASLFLGQARVRRTAVTTAFVGLVTVGAFANEIHTWALRGQDSSEVAQLTGRTKVWTAVMSQDRSVLERLFGEGMSNQSFDGLPIDSNWVSTYQDQGWVGLALQAFVLIFLFGLALTRRRGPHRGIALFLVVYCSFASVTETGLGGPSAYLLDLFVAASLVATEDGRPS